MVSRCGGRMKTQKRTNWKIALIKVKEYFDKNPNASMLQCSKDLKMSWEFVRDCIRVLRLLNVIPVPVPKKKFHPFMLYVECECGKTIFIRRTGKRKIQGNLK